MRSSIHLGNPGSVPRGHERNSDRAEDESGAAFEWKGRARPSESRLRRMGAGARWPLYSLTACKTVCWRGFAIEHTNGGIEGSFLY